VRSAAVAFFFYVGGPAVNDEPSVVNIPVAASSLAAVDLLVCDVPDMSADNDVPAVIDNTFLVFHCCACTD
jgi:hypothetical protein